MCQQAMLIKMRRWRRRPAEEWLEFHRRCHRAARDLLGECRWDRLAALRHLMFAGHLARADMTNRLAVRLLRWRSSGWVREQRALPVRAQIHYAQGAVATWQNRWDSACDAVGQHDRIMVGGVFLSHPLNWMVIAQQRELWRDLVRQWVSLLPE